MTDFVGRVDSVFTRQFSASIAAPASAGATTLTVIDGDDLDPAGQVLTPWDSAVYDYTFDGTATVTLSTPLATAAEAGEILLVWDSATAAPVVDTIAHVAVLGVDNADDVVEARVSFPLIPLLSEGIRDEATAEAVTVRTDGSDYVVAEVLGQAALIDGAMIDPATVPPAATDGLAPGSNPAVTLRPGIGSLFVVWEPIDNADPVSYDIYAVPAADAARLAYPPLATDWIGSSDGTGAGFRALPDGTELTPAGSYAVAVYARDKDGQCTTSATPVVGAPAQVTSDDLALNALTVDHLTGNDALFIALQAEDITGVNITGSSIVGTVFETATGGNRWRMGSAGQAANLEAIPSLSTGAPSATAKLQNVVIDTGTLQDIGAALATGSFVGGAQGVIGVSAQRTRATTGDPWGTQTTRAYITGQDTVIDAGSVGVATVGLRGNHVVVNTYVGADTSFEVYTGDVTLDGDESVTISSPSITLDGTIVSQGRLTASVATFRATANGTAPGAILGTEATPSVWSSSVLRGFTYSAGTWTCNAPGMYFVFAKATWAGDTGANWACGLQMWKNGAQMGGINDVWLHSSVITNSNGPTLSTPVYFAAGDQIQMSIWQNSGSAKTPNTVQISLTALPS